MGDRIYLDNAATSWPKPPAVYQAVEHYLKNLGAPAGRSAYREAAEVDRLQSEARSRAARLLGIDQPERLIFTANGTDSLNLAIHGVLRPGDHVVTTVVEHNSVLRPLRHLESQGLIEVTRVGCDGSGVVDPDEIARAVRPATRLIALVHVSNVTGAIQPAEQVGRIAAEREVVLLVDAAQSAGHIPFTVGQLGAHLLAAPAHKGLLSPLGLGLLYVAPGVEHRLAPVRQGGTGTQSDEDVQPETLPDKYESGNANSPAIVGLNASAAFLEERGLDAVAEHKRRLTARLLDGLQAIRGVTVYGPRDPKRQVGVVSINVAGYDPREVAAMLDASHRVQVRPGIHCAPRMHEALGTKALGGTVRFSLGVFTTEQEIDTAIRAVEQIASAAPSHAF